MFARIFVTVVLLGFALGAFFGHAPEGGAGPFNPFGLLFLFIAFVVWRGWGVITGGFSPGNFDGLVGPLVDRRGSGPRDRDERGR